MLTTTSSQVRYALATLVTLAAMLAGTSAANAASGNVTGSLHILLRNGSYCPTSRDCTGSIYTESGGGSDNFNTQVPVRNVKVYVYSPGPGVVGQGSTDDNGDYNVSWSYSGNLPNPTASYVYWVPDQKDGRFFIRYTDGSYRWYPTWNITLVNGTTNVGWAQWGKDEQANAYWGGEVTWRLSLSLVGVLISNFTGLEIRGFANTIAGFRGTCITSCANGSANQIQLDASAAYAGQARIMHEMGHIANYKVRAYTVSTGNSVWGSYCWNSTTYNASCDWGLNTAEWGSTAFEEGMATFAADSTLYYPNAPAPHSCYASEAPCSTGTFNIETSSFSGATNNCVTDEGRFAVSVMRYLWDVYDSTNDGETISEGPASYWRMFDVLTHYATGVGFNDNDGPWNFARTAVTTPDWRGTQAYVSNYQSAYSVAIGAPRTTNCSPQ